MQHLINLLRIMGYTVSIHPRSIIVSRSTEDVDKIDIIQHFDRGIWSSVSSVVVLYHSDPDSFDRVKIAWKV